MRSPLFTVAIICFNHAVLVREAIESALAQEFRDFELVLVDDASTDGSADVLREYSDRATVVIREQNGGEMASRNSALAASRGEYVAYLDSDDLWFPWTLATFAEAIERHQRPTVVGGCIFDFADPVMLREVVREPYADATTSCYFTGSYAPGVATAAIRRAAIEEVGGFVEQRFAGLDADLMYRIGDRPGFVKIESPYTFGYRQHGGNLLTNVEMRYRGAKQWIETELAGGYPGGAVLRTERLRHITVQARAISIQCLARGRYRLAWDLYRRMFAWNVGLRRWTYLVTFPLMALCPPLIRVRDSYFRRKRAQRS